MMARIFSARTLPCITAGELENLYEEGKPCSRSRTTSSRADLRTRGLIGAAGTGRKVLAKDLCSRAMVVKLSRPMHPSFTNSLRSMLRFLLFKGSSFIRECSMPARQESGSLCPVESKWADWERSYGHLACPQWTGPKG